MGTGSFLGVKRPGHGVDHPPPSSAEVKERIELYLYSPSGPLWTVLEWTLTFSFNLPFTAQLHYDVTAGKHVHAQVMLWRLLITIYVIYYKTFKTSYVYNKTSQNTEAAWVLAVAICVWNVMAHAQKPDFVFRRNGRVYLNRRGRQFSRLLAAEVCASDFIVGSNAGLHHVLR